MRRLPGRPKGATKNVGGPRGSYDVTELWGKHKEILRRSTMGQSNIEIAEAMGISTNTVSYTRRSTLGRKYMENLDGQIDSNTIKAVSEKIEATAPKALEVLTSVMVDDGSPAAVRVRAAMDLLDRAGLGAVKRTENLNAHTTLTREDIDELKRRARESGVIATTATDIEDAQYVDQS